jgi:hypothetical protein
MTPKTGAIRLATLRLFLPDGGCALSGLRSVRPAFNLFTMLTETAGVGGLKTPGGAAAYRGYSAVRFGSRRRRNASPPLRRRALSAC